MSLSLIKSDLPEKWQEILSDLITDPKELVQLLDLNPADNPVAVAALEQFPLKVPRPLVGRMEKGNWNDPLLRQVWPAMEEEREVVGYSRDPLAEAEYNPLPGLLHKYDGRVLLTAAPHCAVHCRYCFRRHFDYAANGPGRAHWQQVLSYIRKDSSIEEVILSGGDPLALADRQLGWLLDHLAGIPHLTTLRIHSRLPVVIPQRITEKLTTLLRRCPLQTVLVIHCNHPRELSRDFAAAMNMLSANGVTILNQSVVLSEVNDNSSILTDLSKALFARNVLPYYLHLPDPVAGTAHFAVSEDKALAIIEEMKARLPGYLVPRLVREQAGEAAKTRLG